MWANKPRMAARWTKEEKMKKKMKKHAAVAGKYFGKLVKNLKTVRNQDALIAAKHKKIKLDKKLAPYGKLKKTAIFKIPPLAKLLSKKPPMAPKLNVAKEFASKHLTGSKFIAPMKPNPAAANKTWPMT